MSSNLYHELRAMRPGLSEDPTTASIASAAQEIALTAAQEITPSITAQEIAAAQEVGSPAKAVLLLPSATTTTAPFWRSFGTGECGARTTSTLVAIPLSSLALLVAPLSVKWIVLPAALFAVSLLPIEIHQISKSLVLQLIVTNMSWIICFYYNLNLNLLVYNRMPNFVSVSFYLCHDSPCQRHKKKFMHIL